MKPFIDIFENRYQNLQLRTKELVGKLPFELIYRQVRENNALFPVNSCGEYILRSAAAVEQTFGGITTKLWDDPFEWTLPEALSSNELILNYLDEVEQTRRNGFAYFQSDEDLTKQIPAPAKLKSLFEILLETILRAEHFQGRAEAVFEILTDEKIGRR